MSIFSDNKDNTSGDDRKKRVVKKVIIKRAATQKLTKKKVDDLINQQDPNAIKRILPSQEFKPKEEEDRKRTVPKKIPSKIKTKKTTTKKLSRETAEEVLRRKQLETRKTMAATKKLTKEAALKILSPAKPPEKVEKKEIIDKIEKQQIIKIPDKETAKELPKPGTVIPENWIEIKITGHKKLEDLSPIEEILPVNTKLKSKKNEYKITEIIQKDKFGGIYKAININEKDPSKAIKAIKEIQYKIPGGNPPGMIKDVMNRLNRMTSFLEDANHPNLANINDYFYAINTDKGTGRFFAVMEFIEGRTLKKVIMDDYFRKGEPFPSDLLLKIIKELCDILQYLHNRKPFPISFGDLKPSNIMLKENFSIKLINYGLDKAFETDTEKKRKL